MNENGNYTSEDVKISEGEITEAEWSEKYKPKENHLAGYPMNHQFETYGDEWEFVKSQDPHYVWTWIEGDFTSLIVPGIAFVNRLAYYVCEVPWTNEDEVVLVSVEVECTCYNEERGDNEGEYGDPECVECEGYGYRTEHVE
jgi:hypothetical protein